ncbi:hypothetical protein [Falsiroseomonas oryziterrae]|uniref:hypothetical protein n=1 Tax=Falsiroseomonas oryziterrae TaxID=2911368 RepID=UPI001F4572A2|nr:hypothetical protein [Roseomonas sp. NPKOSM-4]
MANEHAASSNPNALPAHVDVDEMRRADIVLATCDDGSRAIIKGERLLQRIASGGRARDARTVFVSLPSEAEALMLIRILRE